MGRRRRSGPSRRGPGLINKQVIGTFTSHRALFEWLDIEAKKRGYGQKKVIFLADGSDHIWKLQKEFFPVLTAKANEGSGPIFEQAT